MVFRNNLKSLERRWEKKISKFLGHLPSEQIFYRNISLGAPAIIPVRNSDVSKTVFSFQFEDILNFLMLQKDT